jgi:hypothetical protein
LRKDKLCGLIAPSAAKHNGEISMYPRTEYEMTAEDLKGLLAAMKPVRAMMIGGTVPSSQQENANAAWAALGNKYGFDSMTVRPIAGKGDRFFTAVPNETEDQQAARIAKQKEEERLAEISRLENEIALKQSRLNHLNSVGA